MLLTQLKIKGFKSFGDAVTLHFDKGVTAVVGPNGSGKSNIVDAIRWVLGEQSVKNLRSDKMDNVIFNGTRKRKAMQLAEVSMTFRNTRNLLPTEYSEVTISRRLYRDGDGEYRLNDVPCRLKDINSLFLDTGIGPDSYAIIELKMVDQILNDQHNARRALFEEAAGVSKFKRRKKETLKKLEDADADLERVKDLLHEIDKNLKSLEKQAKQAQKYFELKNEYKEASLALAASAARNLRKRQSEVSRLTQEAEGKRAELSAAMKANEAQVEQVKKQLLDKEKELQASQKALNAQVERIRQEESERKVNAERLRLIMQRQEGLERQLTADESAIDESGERLQGLEVEVESVGKQLAESEAKLAALKADYEEQKRRQLALREESEALQQQSKSRQQEAFELRQKAEVSEVQRTTARRTLERLTEELQGFDNSRKQITEEVAAIEAEKLQAEKERDELEEKDRQLQSQVERSERSLQAFQEELTKLNRSLDAKQNEYKLTRSMVDSMEGFPEAIRFLSQQENWKDEALLLSDVVGAPERYRAAIEHYLGQYLNYYVVESEREAFRAVSLLAGAAKGKANFFMLSAFAGYRSQTSVQYESALPVAELVECKPRYRFLVNWLFDGVYIYKGAPDRIPRDSPHTFVVSSGQIVKRPQSVSGGSIGLFEGKRLGRAQQLEALEADIHSLQEKKEQLQVAISERESELFDLRAARNPEGPKKASAKVSEVAQRLVSAKTRQEQQGHRREEIEERKQEVLEQLAELEASIEEFRPACEAAEQALAKLESNREGMYEYLDAQNEAYGRASAMYNDENLRFHQLSNRVDALEKERDYKRNALKEARERIGKAQEEKQGFFEERERLQNADRASEKKLLALYEEREGIEAGLREAERSYYAQRQGATEVESAIGGFRKQRDDVDSSLLRLKEEASSLRVNVQAVRERAKVEFGQPLDEAAELSSRFAGKDESALRRMAEEARLRIDRLGAVNHMAVEAFDEMKKRHDFIVEQRDDLKAAKESLLQTVDEIDAHARQAFMGAFEQIRENFQKVFRSLFTADDSADLLLAEPDDPLNSRIEIMARPKGKRPLTINQLSGGEKTLTATSLLFSIYLLKPAPFCIFDEVDAPLDDANIDKFNNIVRDFSEQSQFIVVTHNKRTMASTDVIYGVTMVEAGVSTVVPVDMREVDEYELAD